MSDFVFLEDPPVRLPFTCAGGDTDRFACAFERVARRIPPDERRLLLKYWRQHSPAPAISVEDVPVIEAQMIEGRAIAIALNVNGQGLALRFSARAMAEMADEILDTLIAHELAHTVINRQINEGKLPLADQETWAGVGLDARDRIELAKQITDWSETAADTRTLRWDRALDCARLRDWANTYLRNLGYRV